MIRRLVHPAAAGLWLGASAGALPLRGSGCRNLALPGVYEQASTLFLNSHLDFLLLNLTHTIGEPLEKRLRAMSAARGNGDWQDSFCTSIHFVQSC